MAHMNFELLGPGAFAVTIAFWILWIIVNVAFAVGVFVHARDRRVALVGPRIWTLATLLGGPFVAVAYWIVHSSSLAPLPEEDDGLLPNQPQQRTARSRRR